MCTLTWDSIFTKNKSGDFANCVVDEKSFAFVSAELFCFDHFQMSNGARNFSAKNLYLFLASWWTFKIVLPETINLHLFDLKNFGDPLVMSSVMLRCYWLRWQTLLRLPSGWSLYNNDNNETHKIPWGFAIQTDHRIQARSRDLVLINKKKRTCHLMVFDLPVDYKGKVKEDEKIDKHLNSRTWKWHW